MRIRHGTLWLSMLWIIIGGACFGVGILSGAHVLTLLGLIILPAGMLYTLLAGYPRPEAPNP
ncbi:MAG TPA: hypothetical protein VK066_26140 [Chloroflexota bacterium]|nr:hypothetical protein [Chloroflexota bacterium]